MRRRLLIAAAVTTLAGCGVNPVTGERELQFVSESQELAIGAQQYAPARQSQGGDFKTMPELTVYVNEVGQRLAAVSDRPLPYEFVVLNSSVPNAWALPGGKIAVNRGLLTALESEAELAAVLGHEIVHAAARHGAQAQERGTLLQAGMLAAGIGAAMSGVDQNLAGLMLGGASVGAQLINQRYGRDAELESDLYGMRYMQRAGYDPWGAVTLQEKFVALSEQGGRQQSWLDGLFASHPPSMERVETNKRTAAELGRGGETGADRYQARLKPLLDAKPAYDQYDQALVAARQGDLAKAQSLAQQAARSVPREARFQQLLGDLARHDGKPTAALAYYDKAINMDPDYFAPYVSAGITQYEHGDRAKAEQWLTKSAKLLPTAPAIYYLGNIARDQGNVSRAMDLYSTAATSQSDIGKQAAAAYAELDAPRNPGKYIATGPQLDSRGRLLLILENRSPLTLADLVVTPVLVDGNGQIVRTADPVRINRRVAAGERITVDTGIGSFDPQYLSAVRFRIDSARPVGP